jgi:hypothetical protein
MSRVSHLPKSIPSKEIGFKFKAKGALTGHQYTGDFTVLVPQARQMSRLGVELARLGDGIPFELLDKNTAALNNAIAFLKVCLKEGPAWFVNTPDDEREEGMDYGLDTADVNIPIEIFRQANDLIAQWREKLQGQPAEASGDEPKADKA